MKHFPPVVGGRGVETVLTETLDLFRNHARLLIFAALPYCAVEFFFREGASMALANLRKSISADPDLGWNLVVDLGLPFVLMIMLFLAGLIVSQMLSVVLTHTVMRLLGDNSRTTDVASFVMRLISGQVTISTVVATSSLLAGAAFVVVGIMSGSQGLFALLSLIGVLVAVGVAVALYLRWALWTQTLVIEDLTIIDAFRRSAVLMGPRGVRFWHSPKIQLSLMMLVYSCIMFSLHFLSFAIIGASLAVTGAEDIWANFPPPLVDIPAPIALVVALLQIGLNAALLPIGTLIPTLFYVELRQRYESTSNTDDSTENQA